MTETLPRMTMPEMSETLSITRYVSDWGHGGDMRGFMGDEPKEPSTPLERAAMLAYDVAVLGEPGIGTPAGIDKAARNELVDVLSSALRIAIVDERENGGDGRTDVDRARLVLTSMAMVKTMREHYDAGEPEPLDNKVLEGLRQKSGLEWSSFDSNDAHRVGTGMTDMVQG